MQREESKTLPAAEQRKSPFCSGHTRAGNVISSFLRPLRRPFPGKALSDLFRPFLSRALSVTTRSRLSSTSSTQIGVRRTRARGVSPRGRRACGQYSRIRRTTIPALSLSFSLLNPLRRFRAAREPVIRPGGRRIRTFIRESDGPHPAVSRRRRHVSFFSFRGEGANSHYVASVAGRPASSVV